jgi:putative pyrroloquinoline-quinone-binding quinoprotein
VSATPAAQGCPSGTDDLKLRFEREGPSVLAHRALEGSGMSRVPAKLWVALISTFAAGVLVASIEYAIPASATSRSPVALTSTSASDWPAYLDGTLHSSYNSAETSFTTRNAGTVSMGWHFSQGDGYLSSPVVADGSVYIGANNGWLYQLAAPSGKLLHKIFLGEVSITSCPPPPTGMVSTATVATDPRNRQLTVYASRPEPTATCTPSTLRRSRSSGDPSSQSHRRR